MSKHEILVDSLIEYKERRNYRSVENWIGDALSGKYDQCGSSGFDSFSSNKGDSAYHRYYPLAVELFENMGPMPHYEWWIEESRRVLSNISVRKPTIWIPATATPVMVEIANEASGGNADIFVSDLCQTPLSIIENSFQKGNVHCIRSDIFSPAQNIQWGINSGGADLIMTDAFFSRFDLKELLRVLEVMNNSLRDSNSRILTTMRQPQHTEIGRGQNAEQEQAITNYPKLAVEAFEQLVTKMPSLSEYTNEYIFQLADEYAQNMRSRHAVDTTAESTASSLWMNLFAEHLPSHEGIASTTIPALWSGLVYAEQPTLSDECFDITSRRYNRLVLKKRE